MKLFIPGLPQRRNDPPVLYVNKDLGRIFVPKQLRTLISVPGQPVRPRYPLTEQGIFVATLHRPVFDTDGVLKKLELIWHSITHNERVDDGAAVQANRVFGTSGSTSNGVITAVAVASADLTKTKTDSSLGADAQSGTTNEFTTIGLSRAAGTVSTYTAPASLGATFSQLITKAFSVTGTGQAFGAGLFDSTTVSGSWLYVEDNFSSDPNVINGDTLTVQITISN